MARNAPSIDDYGDGGFRLDGSRHEGSLLIVKDEPRGWSIGSMAELTPESLGPVLEAGRGEVEFLLLGVGARNAMQLACRLCAHGQSGASPVPGAQWRPSPMPPPGGASAPTQVLHEPAGAYGACPSKPVPP